MSDRPSMPLLHKGFDSLDLAFPLTISETFADEIDEVRAEMAEYDLPLGRLDRGDRSFVVHPTGARGGFAYMGSFDSTDNIWFLKKPNGKRDACGLRVSCSARNLAMDGITTVRGQLAEELACFGLLPKPGTESLGRVDFAMDFLAPDFILDADQFVMHPRNSRKRHAVAFDLAEYGRSGRTTSVTIGKNPHRQVIVYDKREEILFKASHMPILWRSNLERLGLPDIDLSKPKSSRVWRVEIRFYKEYLKSIWGVRTFGDLAKKLPAMLRKTVNEIRYTQPGSDRNRSRWPDHPLWLRVREEIECDFATIRTEADKETVIAESLAQKDAYLSRQIAGCTLNRAALRGLGVNELKPFAETQAQQIAGNYEAKPERTAEKLTKAKLRYGKS